MSNEGERRMQTLPCGYCGAKKGERCRTKSGVFAYWSHASRFWLAWNRKLLPLTDEEARS